MDDRTIAPPKPKVLFEAEPFIPYVREEEFDARRKPAAVACATNGCAYCTAHSCAMLKKPKDLGFEGWGVSEEELQDIVTGAYVPKSEMERACFDYVRAASEDPTSVPDEILARLKQHLTPPQSVELACVVGFWKFYNTVHDSL